MVRLEQIGKRYGAATPALADVSLTLEAGGFYVLTGAGGAGKTTLLKIVTLAELPSSGRLALFGAPTATLSRDRRAALRRRIGIVFENSRLIDTLRVADNIALPLRISGAVEARVGANVRALLVWLGLDHLGDLPAGKLSDGERRLVAVARAIVGRPELLVADEPAGALDADFAELLVRVFVHINGLGTTVLCATRDATFARRLGHLRLHLEGGMLADTGAMPGR